MKIKVAVMATNAIGEPDIVVYEVECSKEQYDEGAHFDLATALASEHGYKPAMAFDKNSPAWRLLGTNSIYREFFEKVAVDLQSTYLEGKSCESGADVVAYLGEVLPSYIRHESVDAKFHAVYSTEQRLLCGAYLLEGEELDAYRCEGAVIVEVDIGCSAAIPSAEALAEAAESLIHRSNKHSFSVGNTPDDIDRLMREELALDNFDDIPESFAPILVAAYRAAIESEPSPSRQRAGA